MFNLTSGFFKVFTQRLDFVLLPSLGQIGLNGVKITIMWLSWLCLGKL